MKLPFPKYDAQLVADIEDHLQLAEHSETRTIHKGAAGEGLDSVISVGYTRRCGHNTYFRPMFQVLGGELSLPTQTHAPCVRCLDFSRSWNCPDHPEKGFDTPASAILRLEVDAAIERWLSVEITGHRVIAAGVSTEDGEIGISYEVDGS